MKGATTIARWFFAGAVIALVVSIGNAIWTIAETTVTARHHQTLLDKHETELKSLMHAHERLRAGVLVIFDRDKKGGPPLIEAANRIGTIIRVSSPWIVLLPDDTGEPAIAYKTEPADSIRIREKKTTIADVQPGLRATVFADEKGLAIDIDDRLGGN